MIFGFSSGKFRTHEYSYEAFGEEDTSYDYFSDPNPIRYSGEYFDTESGMTYLRARYYDPYQRRFVSEDPIRDGLNWYVYCGNNPVMFVDPSGLDYDEVINALDAIYNAKNTMNHSTPGGKNYNNAYQTAITQKEVIKKSDVYIENWGGLTNDLEQIISSDNNSLENIKNIKEKVVVAKEEYDTSKLRDDLIFLGVLTGIGIIVIKTTSVLINNNKINYPGDDPTKPFGSDWEWRGSGDPSTGKGSWYNPKTTESLHPDLEHPSPIGPHWDYRPYKGGPEYRWYPNGDILLK